MLDALIDGFGLAQQALFEGVVQPAMFALGLGGRLEEGFVATGWLLVGLVQLAVIALGFGLLERWRPVEPVLDRAAVRTDVAYTLIHRLGLVRLALFFTLDPLWQAVSAWLGLHGLRPLSFEGLWPGVTDVAWVAFLLYLLLFDLVDYALHRAQHGWDWWWQLHALHHSQRQMTRWSDSRNHLLDDALRDSAFVAVALAVGIAPAQFVAVVALTQLLESLSHANLRGDFGPVLGRLLVSPAFHRTHHAIGTGHESHGPGSLGGCNYAVLFPLWDLLFGTARFGRAPEPTGVRDQLDGRDYGRGFWAQQALGLRRLFDRRAGWPGGAR
ncbi:MAG: sterol desaturase family protein [Rubrivivax sp.]|jgi:sterol desaturase/sphingolipid hydroxylase (fatty acid hydroxylase superfamily)|nr:sterol desaturase family protein [Rubrivivax sp.]